MYGQLSPAPFMNISFELLFFFFALAILGLSLKLQNQLLRKYKQMPPAFLVSLRISGLTDQVSKL